MRRMCAVALMLLLATAVVPVLADDTAGTASGGNLSWTALTPPAGDWSAQVIQNVFPVSGSGGVNTVQTTVISKMVGQLTGFVMGLTMAYLCYSTIMQIHRGAETSRILGDGMTGMFFVRLGTAAILMFPIPTLGFSVGQTAVVKVALWGIGLASSVYTNTVQSIGTDGMTIATPNVPGTETLVLGLMEIELCRDLVNAASNTMNSPTQLVPAPSGVLMGLGNMQIVGLNYGLSAGNKISASPACGLVTLTAPAQNAVSLFGVAVDQSAVQQKIMSQVIINDIRPAMQAVAANFFNTRSVASLTPMQAVLQTATHNYSVALTDAATAIQQQLRAAVGSKNANALTQDDSSVNQAQLKAIGWSGAGAYYLEFAKLNGEVLSLLSGVPRVTTPSYTGFGYHLQHDLAPLFQSASSFLSTLNAYVEAQDGIHQPGGSGDLFAGSQPGQNGSAVMEQVLRRLDLNDWFLQGIQSLISPTENNWADPFSALMALGNKMVTTSLAAMGLAALASSGTVTTASAIFHVLTGNFVAAGATVGAHAIVTFLAAPIFALLLGLLIPGMTIAYVLPMIPWVMWMAGVMGWLILVCEAVIAVPLWMLAHMTMQGEGLHGNARDGYELIFNVLFRPTLMLFGLFLGYYVFASMSFLINQTFGIAAGFILERGWLVTNVIGVVILLIIYVLTQVVAATTSFRLISIIPYHVPRMIGFKGANRVDMDQFSRDVAVVGVGGGLAKIDQGVRAGAAAVADSRGGGQGGQGLLQQPNSGNALVGGMSTAGRANNASRGNGRNGMDSTLRAASDIGQPGQEGA